MEINAYLREYYTHIAENKTNLTNKAVVTIVTDVLSILRDDMLSSGSTYFKDETLIAVCRYFMEYYLTMEDGDIFDLDIFAVEAGLFVEFYMEDEYVTSDVTEEIINYLDFNKFCNIIDMLMIQNDTFDCGYYLYACETVNETTHRIHLAKEMASWLK